MRPILVLGFRMREWRLNIDEWPGPDRKKWPGLRDVIQESPEGRYVAVVYSCNEVDIYKEVGLFALFAGPPDSPQLLLRPRGLMRLVWYDGKTVQWFGERFCVVTQYCIRQRWVGSSQAFIGTMFFDVEQRKVAYIPGTTSGEVISGIPDELAWTGWERLSQRPKLWYKR